MFNVGQLVLIDAPTFKGQATIIGRSQWEDCFIMLTNECFVRHIHVDYLTVIAGKASECK